MYGSSHSGKSSKKVSAVILNGNETPLYGLPWILEFNMRLPSDVANSKVNGQTDDSTVNI